MTRGPAAALLALVLCVGGALPAAWADPPGQSTVAQWRLFLDAIELPSPGHHDHVPGRLAVVSNVLMIGPPGTGA